MASSDYPRDASAYASGKTKAMQTAGRGLKTRGPGASAVKYDLLTALMATSAHDAGVEGRLAGRLALLITARFNWQSETFAVGQRELARLWNVTDRTVKREMSAMRALGWLRIVSPPVRGRVARYGIDLDLVVRATARHWDAVGPDFAARMSGVALDTESAETGSNSETNVIPLRTAPEDTPLSLSSPDPMDWHKAAAALRESLPAIHDAWFAGLVPIALDGGRAHLMAPSRFIADYVSTHYKLALLRALSSANAEIRDVIITPPE